MTKEGLAPQEREERFKTSLVSEYLKYGSVDEVYKIHRYDLPISYASFQRLLAEWEIVKAAGPNGRLSETVTFLARLAEEKMSVEALYRRMPPSFRTSLATMYRVYQHVKEGITRRAGTVLVVTPSEDPYKVLVGNDVSTPRLELGKPYGAVSFPIGFSRKSDSNSDMIKRVLQQEVFTKQTIARFFPDAVIPQSPEPFLYIDVADIRVSVYSLTLPKNLSSLESFSSFKLENHRFLEVTDIISQHLEGKNLRAGMSEIADVYTKFLVQGEGSEAFTPYYEKSSLNNALATVGVEVD